MTTECAVHCFAFGMVTLVAINTIVWLQSPSWWVRSLRLVAAVVAVGAIGMVMECVRGVHHATSPAEYVLETGWALLAVWLLATHVRSPGDAIRDATRAIRW